MVGCRSCGYYTARSALQCLRCGDRYFYLPMDSMPVRDNADQTAKELGQTLGAIAFTGMVGTSIFIGGDLGGLLFSVFLGGVMGTVLPYVPYNVLPTQCVANSPTGGITSIKIYTTK